MQLELWQWAAGALGAFLAGLSKTGLPGLGSLNVALFALAFPLRESVGTVLIILICADLVAIAAYRRDASWTHLWKLFPWAAVGIVLGYLTLGRIDESGMRRLIGGILFILSTLQLVRSRRPANPGDEAPPASRLVASLTGITAGFTTMAANAGGPVMTLYLLAMRVPKIAFVGTTVWYFFLLNLFKLPFSASLGLINLSNLGVSLILGLVAMLGATIGRPIVERLNQRTFELIALALTFVAGLVMLG